MPRSNDLLARIRPEPPGSLHPYEVQVVTRHLDWTMPSGHPKRRFKTGVTVYCLFAYGPKDAAAMWRSIRGDRRLCDCKWDAHEFRVRRWHPTEHEVDWKPEASGLGRSLTSLGRR